jgi:ABC-type multidrug transport system permease subunit
MMEGLIFVALFFISQYFIKQKKVSMVFKLRRYFLFLCILYTLMLSLEIFVSYESIKEVV